jgi:hypothetical protein
VAPETVEKVINSVWLKAGFAGIAMLIMGVWIYNAEAEIKLKDEQACKVRAEHKIELKSCRDDTKEIAKEAITAINELKSTLVEIKIYLREQRYERIPAESSPR